MIAGDRAGRPARAHHRATGRRRRAARPSRRRNGAPAPFGQEAPLLLPPSMRIGVRREGKPVHCRDGSWLPSCSRLRRIPSHRGPPHGAGRSESQHAPAARRCESGRSACRRGLSTSFDPGMGASAQDPRPDCRRIWNGDTGRPKAVTGAPPETGPCARGRPGARWIGRSGLDPGERGEERRPVRPAQRGIGGALGMRHQAQHAAVRGQDPGNAALRAVGVRRLGHRP